MLHKVRNAATSIDMLAKLTSHVLLAVERAANTKSGATNASGAASTVAASSKSSVNTTPFPSDAIFQKIQHIIDTDNAK